MSATDASRRGRGTASEQAYAHVRNRILRGELPTGAVLAETEVAESLGISRTPVRQALRLLLQEGLVAVGPRRQVTVEGISDERRREVYLVRDGLERLAAAEASKVMEIDEVDQLRLLLMQAGRAAAADDVEGFIDLDEQFHLRIAAGARLPLVVKFLEQLRAFVRMMGMRAVLSHEQRMAAVLDEHTAIVDAIEARDTEAAVAAMSHHLDLSRQAHEDYATRG